MKLFNPLLRIVIFLVGLAVINYASMMVGALVGSVFGSKGALGLAYLISMVAGVSAFVFYGRRWLATQAVQAKFTKSPKP